MAPKRTGVMAGNINVKPVKKTSTSVTGTIEAEKEYSSFVEFGTYKMSAEPFMRPAVDWGQSVFIRNTMNKLKEASKFK
ncbi:HK97-gp10 family putative phage morphogenesis protein [Lacticaseibacillus mingshuiensis]|uniref:HK97-gp10 family putative phage morphogenesis protein n=1 Tax=Lacticaseibacillus mingshuiensis TaxID=2799574 RepID=A0ABW4CJ84_9LACO|nr:HK97-gp10 family putative phage morphogenesis protein [Lacticaseibacillus mingshuiensis]